MIGSVLDIDECLEFTDMCHVNATCSDTVGSYECFCLKGFEGNGTFCEGMIVTMAIFMSFVWLIFLLYCA